MNGSDDLIPQDAGAHDVALFGGVDLVAALACKIEGDAGDALDFARRIDGGVDGALLPVFEGHDLLRRAEIGAAGQLAQDQYVEALDMLALQRRGFGERWIADRRAQVGEQVEILAQTEQAGLGALVVGDLVPLRAADGAKQHGIGLVGLGDGVIGDRDIVLVDRGTADQSHLGLELDLPLLVKEGDDALDLRHDLGADAVARQQKQGFGGHRAGSVLRVSRGGQADKPDVGCAGGLLASRSNAGKRASGSEACLPHSVHRRMGALLRPLVSLGCPSYMFG